MFKFHYGWIALLLSFLALLAVQGIRSSFGAFVEPWETEFRANRGTVSLIALLSFFIYGISQPIIGYFIDRVGARKVLSYSTLLVGVSTCLTFFVTSFWQLILLYGIVSSVGFGGASGVAGSVIATNWFHRRKGVALGIITSGMSAGQLVIVPFCLILINWIGWQLTVLILGVTLMFVVFPILIIFLRSHPAEKGLSPYGENNDNYQENIDTSSSENQNSLSRKSFFNIISNRGFWFLAIPYMICGFTAVGLMETHLIPFAHDHGHSSNIAGTTVTVLATFNIIGTLLSGQIADHVNNKKFLFLLYFSRGLTIILLLLSEQVFLLFVFAFLFGLVDFATVAPTMMLANKYFSKQSIGFVFGLLSFSHQIGSALGAYIPGLLYDLSGNYISSFVSAIFLLIGAAFMCIFLPAIDKYESVELDKDNNKDIGV
ncbi:MFS transporter [Alteribacillus sp. HJP-4]|uniref:MFS transporter n=1 Tax=Alteribacillus sp. HJP-4 TaxID=2775394 RepID=UPI0035CCD6E9